MKSGVLNKYQAWVNLSAIQLVMSGFMGMFNAINHRVASYTNSCFMADGKYRKGSRAKRVIIPNRVGIGHRPTIVDKKKRFGDWEANTVLGKNGTGVIVSLVERKSKFYLIRKVPAKSAEEVSRALVGMLWRYRSHVHTITADNGTEFCGHELVAEKLKTDVYFANPYLSWERGLNENFNGLLRQYISKGTDLSTVTDEQIAQAQRALNLRPRKCLGYKQPEVVFNALRGAA